MLYLCQRFSIKQVLIGSIIVALIVGYIPFFGRFLAVQRTLTFFPYFMVGYALPASWIAKIKTAPKKWVAVALFAGIFVLIETNDFINKYWVFGSKPYEDYMNHPLLGGPQRMIFFVLGLAGIMAFFMLVPKGQYFFSKWGKNTLTVYLLHGFLIKGLRALGVNDMEMGAWGVAALFLLSVLLTAALSSERFGKWIEKGKRKVMRPVLN